MLSKLKIANFPAVPPSRKTVAATAAKADKQTIGKSDYPKPFTTHQIEYKENTLFYLFTDGIADQFGGPNGKKFKYKQFSDLLIKNNNLSQKQQADIINKAF